MSKGSTQALIYGRMRRHMEEHPFHGVTPSNTQPPYTLIDAARDLFVTLDPVDIGRILRYTEQPVTLQSVAELVNGAREGATVSLQVLVQATFIDICVSVTCQLDSALAREHQYRMQIIAMLSAEAKQDAMAGG